MATDPSQLLALIASGGPNPFNAAQRSNQDVQLGQQQVQQNAGLLADQAAARQQAQQYQQDVQGYFADPRPEKLGQLIAKYPQQAQQLQQSKAALDEPQRQSQLTQYGQLYSAASSNRYDLLTKQATALKTAEAAQGIDTSEIDDVLGQLQSSDPKAQATAAKQVLALSQAHIAALDPKFAEALTKNGVGEDHFASTGDGAIYDKRTGDVTRQPNKIEYKTVKNADGSETIVQVGGGDPQSVASGTAGGSGGPANGSAGRTVGGWTPRTRNGGNNSDAAVDGKIGGMTKALGLSPTDQFPPGMSNMDIAKALALSEGGTGSIADRQNNPTNLTDGKGNYRKFPNKDAALQAAAAQVARNRARGQNTIQTMVEGLPVGGASAAAPNARALYTSNANAGAGGDNPTLDDDTVSMMASQYLSGDPSVMTNLGRGKQGAANIVRLRSEIAKQARAQGMNGAQIASVMQDYKSHQQGLNAFAKGPEARTVRSLNVTIDHLDTLQNAAQALQNGSIPIFNKVSQAWARATGQPAPTNFEGVRQIVSAEVAKAITGGNTALADRQDLAHSIATSNSPQQLAGYLAEVKKLMAGQLDGLGQQYKSATGRDDFADRLSPRTRHALGFVQGQSSAAPRGAPSVGAIVKGYRFNGGNPALRSSWTPAQ